MLVVVAGATGHIGQPLIDALHARGHQVRAVARNLSALPAARQAKLHSSVTISSAMDTPSLDVACSGADAVVVAYSGDPSLVLDGQIHLLRAAERAGITRFVAAGWSYDYRPLAIGDLEAYDHFKMFARHAAMTSTIKPSYILSGVLAEVFFSVPSNVSFDAKEGGAWDAEEKQISTYGTGDEVWHWTSCRDAAEFAADIVVRDGADKGGFWSVASGTFTLNGLAAEYERIRGRKVGVEILGTVDQLRERALKARAEGALQNERGGYWEYIRLFYHLYVLDGSYVLKELDNERLGTKTTSLEDFLLEHPEV